jgi:tetratricopeptide (TPR) repeat protein
MEYAPGCKAARPASNPDLANLPAALFLLLITLLSGVGCQKPADGPSSDPRDSSPLSAGELFVDRAQELGIDYVHFNGMSGEFYLIEIGGPGGAFFDYDNDGDIDIFIVQGHMLGSGKTIQDATTPPQGPLPLVDRLYRNELIETGRLHFTDVTKEARIPSTGYGMGVAAGDYDRDGWVDLYITNFGPNMMLRNNGDGTFSDVTENSGAIEDRWSISAAFLDYDRDGHLDLFIINYVDFTYASHKICFGESSLAGYCGPSSYRPYPDRLYRNRGDGTFEDVTAVSQIARDYGAALGVVTADFNGDSWVDIYVANDAMPNQMWINQGDGTFRDDALLSGAALNADGRAEASMGIDAADFDSDGDEDLFITHIIDETNTLYVNDGSGWFEDHTSKSGLGMASRSFTGFGTSWVDYDNDGWLDLVIANGAVKAILELERAGDPFPLHHTNQVFRNLGDGRFEEVTEYAGEAFKFSAVSRGASFGDVDNDGGIDVMILNNNGPTNLLVNQVGSRNAWIGLRLMDATGTYDMLGTRVEVILADGRHVWRRLRVAASYSSSNDSRVVVGLGTDPRIRVVRTYWPDGSVEAWPAMELNRYSTLRMGQGSPPGLDERLIAKQPGPAAQPSTPARDRAARREPIKRSDGLVEIPYPSMERLDEAVQRQLTERRAELEAVLSRPATKPGERSLAYGEAGMLFHAYNFLDAAEACYHNAEMLEPDEARWPYYLGHVYRMQVQPELAVASYERSLQLQPSYIPTKIRLARIELEQLRYERAEELFREVLERDSDSAAAYVGLGKVATARSEFELAVGHLETARRLDPEATEINYLLGLAYRGQGQREKAVELIQQRGEREASLHDPLIADVMSLSTGMRIHQLRGTALYQQGLYQQALVEFRKAVEADPDEPLVRTNLGLTLAVLGDFDGAMRELETALRLDPEDTFAHANMGALLVQLGRDDEAVEHYERAVSLDPGQLQAHFDLGNALRRLGRYDECLEHYRRVVEGDPRHGSARMAEALALTKLERYAEARGRLEEAHAALPEDRGILNALVRVMAAAPDDAVRDGRQALQSARGLVVQEMSVEDLQTLAMVAAENGVFREAVRFQRRAVEWVEYAGLKDQLPALQAILRGYEAGRPCRDPWPTGHPLLEPRPRVGGS